VSITITLFGQILTFALLVAFVWRFLWSPMTEMMAGRQKRISDGLAASDRGKQELELAKQAAALHLREAKQHASDIITSANKRGNKIIEEAKDQAIAEGKRKLDAALTEIELEFNRAREDLRKQVANVALATAEKILEREIDAAAHSELLNTMIQKL
jgi:F-type H+-transporting ATPase subunit b